MVAPYLHVTTTLTDRESADRLAATLISERLAACAQVNGPVHSTYWWRGAVQAADEWRCELKTTGARLQPLMQRIRELHAYECPEIIALPIIDGSPEYLRWLEEAVRTRP